MRKARKLRNLFWRSLKLRGCASQVYGCCKIPYFDEQKVLVFTRYCTSLPPKGRFIKKRGSKPVLYGLWKLKEAVKAKSVVLVEGESNCHTLWFNKFPALGLPEATLWKENRDALHLKGIPTIYWAVKSDKEGTSYSQQFAKIIYLGQGKGIGFGGIQQPERHVYCGYR